MKAIWKDAIKHKCRRKKLFLLLLACSLAIFIYYTLNMRSYAWYANRKKLVGDPGHRCLTPMAEIKALKELIVDIHNVLDDLKLTHCLIYGSLWGALRYKDPLPWDNDVDMALFENEVNSIDFELMKEKFNEKDINISYRVWLGTYRVTRGDTARGDLMVFKKSFFGNMWRTGIEPWVFFVNYRRFHTFPAHLTREPLPKMEFAGVNISVPRQGIEIQKYFYPHDWWKESKPRGC